MLPFVLIESIDNLYYCLIYISLSFSIKVMKYLCRFSTNFSKFLTFEYSLNSSCNIPDADKIFFIHTASVSSFNALFLFYYYVWLIITLGRTNYPYIFSTGLFPWNFSCGKIRSMSTVSLLLSGISISNTLK